MSGKGKHKLRKLPAKHAAPAETDGETESFGPRGEVVFARSSFSGPMPPPDLVAQYEELLPGAAKFFFVTLDRQTTHRHALEAKVIDANISSERGGCGWRSRWRS